MASGTKLSNCALPVNVLNRPSALDDNLWMIIYKSTAVNRKKYEGTRYLCFFLAKRKQPLKTKDIKLSGGNNCKLKYLSSILLSFPECPYVRLKIMELIGVENGIFCNNNLMQISGNNRNPGCCNSFNVSIKIITNS